MNPSAPPFLSEELSAWNEAHDRVLHFLKTFALSDSAQVSRLTLQILDLARKRHRENPSVSPVTLVMEETRRITVDWFASNLALPEEPRSRLFASGYIALFLSHMPQKAPDAFLISRLPEDLRLEMKASLLVTGPDLQISSMTPRHLDYGPMHDFARETWHRWSSREILIALLFWTGIYFVFYWWLSDLL